MKAPTSTLVRLLVGSVRTATAAAVMRLASMSLASEIARVVLKRLSSSVDLALLGERDLRVEVRERDELLDRAEAAVGDDLLLRRACGGEPRVHDPELRADVCELLLERVDLRLRVATHLVHGLPARGGSPLRPSSRATSP